MALIGSWHNTDDDEPRMFKQGQERKGGKWERLNHISLSQFIAATSLDAQRVFNTLIGAITLSFRYLLFEHSDFLFGVSFAAVINRAPEAAKWPIVFSHMYACLRFERYVVNRAVHTRKCIIESR